MAVVVWLMAPIAPAQARIAGYAGRFIAFERAGDIWLTSDDGQQQMNLTNSTDREGHPSWGLRLDACVTGDGRPLEPETRTLVYERRTGAARDIFRATVDGSAAPVLSSPANVTQSPDRDESEPAAGVVTATGTPVVAFTVAGQGIWAMPLDGSAEATQLTSEPSDAHPDWAPDGASIAFDTEVGGTRQIAILAVSYAAGVFTPSGRRVVTAGPLAHAHPSRFDYSGVDPNTGEPVTRPSRLLYATTYPDLGLDYLDFLQHSPDVVPADQLFAPGSNPPPKPFELTGDPGGDSAPNIRPEGGGAAFQSTRDAAGNVDIYTVGSDGAVITRLTTDPAADVDPDWEPITEPGGGQCLEPLPQSPDPGPGRRPRRGRPAPSGGGGGGSGGGGATPGGRNPDGGTARSGLSVRGVRVTVSRAGGRRIIGVRLVVDRGARAQVRLRRGPRVVARGGYRLHRGSNRLRLVVPRKVTAGRYRLTIRVRSAPWSRTITRTVRLGR